MIKEFSILIDAIFKHIFFKDNYFQKMKERLEQMKKQMEVYQNIHIKVDKILIISYTIYK